MIFKNHRIYRRKIIVRHIMVIVEVHSHKISNTKNSKHISSAINLVNLVAFSVPNVVTSFYLSARFWSKITWIFVFVYLKESPFENVLNVAKVIWKMSNPRKLEKVYVVFRKKIIFMKVPIMRMLPIYQLSMVFPFCF